MCGRVDLLERAHAVPGLGFRVSEVRSLKIGKRRAFCKSMAGSARVSKTTVVERVEREDHLDEDGVEVMLVVVVHVRPSKGARRRCGRCGRRCVGYDSGRGRRRWRTLDLGPVRAVIEADARHLSQHIRPTRYEQR